MQHLHAINFSIHMHRTHQALAQSNNNCSSTFQPTCS